MEICIFWIYPEYYESVKNSLTKFNRNYFKEFFIIYIWVFDNREIKKYRKSEKIKRSLIFTDI